MIDVRIDRDHEEIVSVLIAGHADSGTAMIDMVCAEVSAISVGVLNAIEELCPSACQIQMESGYVHIEVIQSSAKLQIIVQTLEIQLMTVEYTNQNYIKVRKAEV